MVVLVTGYMIPEVWCDTCLEREQIESEGTLRDLRADLRRCGWERRWIDGELKDICDDCTGAA